VRRAGPITYLIVLAGCAPSEAPRVELPVLVDDSGLSTAVTDLGWTIELDQARLALADLRFTTSGEVHMDQRPSAAMQLLSQLSNRWIRSAHAHPGHAQGGEVIGELPGTFVIDFRNDDGRELGIATLIVGEYTALDFRLARAGADQVDESDALFGHTALLAGTATGPDDAVISFTVVIDSPVDREIVGVPFEASVAEDSTFEIGLRMLGSDPIEGDHLFDGIDFALLDAVDGAADGVMLLVDPETNGELGAEISDAYYQVRREFQTHDLFDAIVREP
jgi:hypothetical protein